jgi:hypothetical protein
VVTLSSDPTYAFRSEPSVLLRLQIARRDCGRCEMWELQHRRDRVAGVVTVGTRISVFTSRLQPFAASPSEPSEHR